MTASADSFTLKLGKRMTLAEAQEFYDEAAALNSAEFPSQIVIDAVENEVIEFPILQILAAVFAEAQARGSKVSWDNPSIAVFERSVALGLDDALGL